MRHFHSLQMVNDFGFSTGGVREKFRTRAKNPRRSSLPCAAATRPASCGGERAVSTNSRGGAGGAQGEGVALRAPSLISPMSGRLIISRAYVSPAKRFRNSGADLKMEKEL